MFGENTIAGPGYSVQVPPGFTFAGGMPEMGVYRLMPPGVSPFDVEALLQIQPKIGTVSAQLPEPQRHHGCH